MVKQIREQYEAFQKRIPTLGGIWNSKYVTFSFTPKFFIAAYEPSYPTPSDKDRIITYGLDNKNYMLFKQSGSGCRLNESSFEDLRKAWYMSLLDEM